MLRNVIAATGLLAAGAILIGAAHANMMNVIDVKDAEISGESVVIPMVKAAKDGYLVVHAMKDGKPVVPGSLGHTSIKAGENVNVAVRIDGGAHSGVEYMAMLHDETNGNGTYDFGADSTTVDTPTMEGDKPVVATFTIGN